MGRSINSGSTPCPGSDFNYGMSGQNSAFHVFFDERQQPQGGGSPQNVVITLRGTEGTLTATEQTLLKNNINGLISLDGRLYRIQLKDMNRWVYTTASDNMNDRGTITVDIPNYTWTYTSVSNQVLEDHINDSSVHVTPEDRAYWNDKINCYAEDESLIFARE